MGFICLGKFKNSPLTWLLLFFTPAASQELTRRAVADIHYSHLLIQALEEAVPLRPSAVEKLGVGRSGSRYDGYHRVA